MAELITSPSEQEEDADSRRATNVVGGSMAFVAIRCTLQYVILPFVLPWFGLGEGISAGLSLVIELVALGMIFYNVVRLWNTSWRWGYLAWSLLMVFIISVFLISDIRILWG